MNREAFYQAVPFFVDAVSRISPGQWDAPALGVWNVRDLVGHTSRAITLVEQYATVGAEGASVGSAQDIAERGRVAGQALGNDPASAVRDLAKRVVELVESLPDDHPLNTSAGERPLVRYLGSRVTELTVHTMDLADAVGVAVEPPVECMRVTLYGLSDMALRQGVAKEVAFALTGRRALAEGFTLVP